MQTVASTSTRLDQWMKIATLALIAGASMWLVKLVVIVITDGAESGAGDAAAAGEWTVKRGPVTPSSYSASATATTAGWPSPSPSRRSGSLA